jgi:hypothetical protein
MPMAGRVAARDGCFALGWGSHLPADPEKAVLGRRWAVYGALAHVVEEHDERRWGRWQSARTGAVEEFAGTFSADVGVKELPMAKGQKRSAKEAKKPKANKPKTSVSDYKKSVIASGHK